VYWLVEAALAELIIPSSEKLRINKTLRLFRDVFCLVPVSTQLAAFNQFGFHVSFPCFLAFYSIAGF